MADKYSEPIGTLLTPEIVAAVEARAVENMDRDKRVKREKYLSDQAAQRADNLDPEARARRVENILPPRPTHLAGAITHEKIRALVEARYGYAVSSIAITFKDGAVDYIVSPAE